VATENDLRYITHIGDLSTDGMFVYDDRAKSFSYVNASLLRFFDFDETNFPNVKDILKKIIDEDREYLQAAYLRLKQNSVVENVEFRMRVLGVLKTFCCSAYQITESVIGFVEDLTKIREHDAYITAYGAKKDAILEMVSHNLSGPLNMSHHILTSLEKVTSGYGNQEVNKHLELIRESMNHCIDVINDLMIEEHLISETVYIKKTRFDVIHTIHNTLERLRKSFPEKEFHFSSLIHPLFLNSDEVKFFQVFHNLVLNSVKFTQENGTIEVDLDTNADHLFLTIRDNGIGIPDALKPYIFAKYSAASRPGLKNERSIGIGLYITHKLVTLLGGTITFSSAENLGSTFSIKLPLE
jgi:two-component system, OmpR family, sensor histidine kinase VicK